MSDSNDFLATIDIVGRRVGLSAVEGKVVAVDRWTETNISSSAGMAYVSGNQIAVVPPRVWATAAARKAVWIRTAADEIQVPVPEGLQVRPGHHVHAVVATAVGQGTSQWAAIVNHDTNRWTQVDVFPPSGCYDVWTGPVMAFGQAMGNLAVSIMGLYGAVFAMLFYLVGGTGASFLTGLFGGMGIGLVHTIIGQLQSGAARKRYGTAVKDACNRVFAASRAVTEI